MKLCDLLPVSRGKLSEQERVARAALSEHEQVMEKLLDRIEALEASEPRS